MDPTIILIFFTAVLTILLLVIIFAPRPQPRAEYVIEAPYPNLYAFWPSPYYYGWTSGGSWRPRPFHGHRTSYGYGSGWSSGGSHSGGGHSGGSGGGGHGGGGH